MKRMAVFICSCIFYRYSEHSKTWPGPPRTRSPRLKLTKSAAYPTCAIAALVWPPEQAGINGRTSQGSGQKTFISGQKPALQLTSDSFQPPPSPGRGVVTLIFPPTV